jgi:hypothetical protein
MSKNKNFKVILISALALILAASIVLTIIFVPVGTWFGGDDLVSDVTSSVGPTFNNVEFCYVVDNIKNKEVYSTMQGNFSDCSFIKNGTKTLIRFKNSRKKFDFCAIEYFQACFDGDFNTLINICFELNIKKIFDENIENKKVVYGYTNVFKKYKMYKNKKINFQLVLRGQEIIVGYPMIYSSF